MNSREVKRNAILIGNREASKLHKKLDLKNEVTQGFGFIDVYSVIDRLDIPFLFKKLDGLLGFCITKPYLGIMINEARPPMMQRFTAAHELGHVVLGHEGSFDRQVFEVVEDDSDIGRPPEEISADAFASAFLLPKWLYNYHFERLGWDDKKYLFDPMNIYQLSLRLAASYEATAWGLSSHSWMTYNESKNLAATLPGKLKKTLMGEIPLENSYADVWRLGIKDNGASFPVKFGDYVVLDLPALASAGYRWTFTDAAAVENDSIKIVSDQQIPHKDTIGGEGTRHIILSIMGDGVLTLNLGESRPWQMDIGPKRTFSSSLQVVRPEAHGLANIARKKSFAG
jgi:Zn-dependent peptidase ImmA (M78 family)/predicted secreted protein